eukprot:GHVS01078283.1.p1 GENE.GHVS01078283.1~~GHVS01078283.1.p1  ORF type:complete len:243 (-),score=56.57 GHVS01078283.1:178-906(-)
MSTFMGMPSGRSLLLCAAVTALCVSLASAAADKKRTVANSDKLLNNLYGTVVTADKPWTDAMIKEFSAFAFPPAASTAAADQAGAAVKAQAGAAPTNMAGATPEELEVAAAMMEGFDVSDPVVLTNNKNQIVFRVILKKRAEKRAANNFEINVVSKMSSLSNSADFARIESFESTGGDGWKVTKVAANELVYKHGVDNNINEGMSEEFYAAFPASSSSAYGLAVNKVVVGLGVVVATFLAVC